MLYEEYRRLDKENVAAQNKAGEAVSAVKKAFPEEQWPEALKRAGVPALKKKEEALSDAWMDVIDRILNMRVKTPAGMIVKFKFLWADWQKQNWAESHSYNDAEFPEDVSASVLLDLEQLADQRRVI